MKTLFLLLIFILNINFTYGQDCTYQICLEDSWGDGWNNASLYVVTDETTHNLTLNNGDEICYLLETDHPQNILLNFNSGFWDDECYISVYDGDGNTLIDSHHIADNDTSVNICEYKDGDCHISETICDNSDIESNPTGKGNYQELNSSNHGTLLGNEHYSNWIYFHTQVDCEICFTISNNTNTDYDFAVWEGISCPPTSQPIRCSWAWHVDTDGDGYYEYDTGLRSSDNCYWEKSNQDTCGNNVTGFVSCINANAGDEFTLLIDNYDGDVNPFTLTWYLCDDNALECVPLPVEFISSSYDCDNNILSWSTASELNSDYYKINIGHDFEVHDDFSTLIVDEQFIISANGNINEISNYNLNIDFNKKYYQIIQYDYDGHSDLLTTNFISCVKEREISINPNPTKDYAFIDANYETIQIFDMSGKEIYATIKNNRISGLSDGFYIVIIDGFYKFKLIIEQ